MAEEKKTAAEKLHAISTPAEENWLEIANKWEAEDTLEEAATEFANQDCVTFISRKRGFIAGAEWQKKQNTIRTRYKTRLDCYEQGRQDMREEMLKDAVEGEVIEDLHGQRYVKSEAVDGIKFKFGDKVKIVIVPDKED